MVREPFGSPMGTHLTKTVKTNIKINKSVKPNIYEEIEKKLIKVKK